MFFRKKAVMPSPVDALPGRTTAIAPANEHFVLKRPLAGPYPAGIETAIFGLGCFWGAERKLWQMGEGIWVTAVGYAGGFTPNPTYEEVCSGATGHNEVVLVAFDPARIAFAALLNELRALGGNTAPDRAAGLHTPRWRRDLERELSSLRGPDGKLGLSFEVAYGHAFKAAPRLRADQPTMLSLDDMRAMLRAGRASSGKGLGP